MSADEIIRLLEQLSEVLSPTAQHVFELAVKQVYIQGFVSLGVAILGFVACAACAWAAISICKEN